MVSTVKTHKSEPVIILLPPRIYVSDKIHGLVVHSITEKAREWGIRTVDIRNNMETNDQFRDKLQKDGIHLQYEQIRNTIRKILKEIGESDELEPEGTRWNFKDFFPNICWICGDKHKRGERCSSFSRCHLCGDDRHSHTVCRATFQSCRSCGARGHSRAMCRGSTSS